MLGAILVSFAGFSQQGITYRFNNMKIAPAAGPDTLIFDVEAKGTTALTYTTTFTIKVYFNPAVFGNFAVPVVAEQLVLTQPTGYNFNTPIFSAAVNKFQSSFQAFKTLAPHTGTYQIAFLSNLTTEYQGVVRYKMLITGSGDCGIDFHISGAGSMALGNNYVLTNGASATINYNPVAKVGDLLTLPSAPNTSLFFSEIGDPSDLTSNSFVEIYNAGATTVDFTNHYAWYFNVNETTSTKLSGTLAAGAVAVIPITDGGTSSFLLTTYGDYTSGTDIDIYNGAASGYDFTGKHAVRHYNIIAPNATFTGSEWVISPAEDIDMTDGSHRATLNWVGATAAWRNQANWGGYIPDAGHNAAIGAGTTPVIALGSNAYAHDLSIGSAGLTIESLPGGDGSLITYGTVTGTASVERYLGADRYWYVTKPVTAATANVFLHMWLFTYTGGDWTPFIYDETTSLNQMQGYAVWTSSINSYDNELPPIGSTTTSYDGTLNSGAISTGLVSGWNFVGNPYPSAVDWDAAGWTKTGLTTGGYLVWNGTTNAQYVGGVGTNGATKDIHAAQGFFVEASGAGTLGVTNAVRLHSAQTFLKGNDVQQNLLRLAVSNGEIQDETVIYFKDEATSGLDYDFDAHKMISEAAPQAYTMLNNEKMAISAFNNTTETSKVVLGVNTPVAGDYTISAANLESFDASIPVYLEDVVTGSKVDLREMSTYAFSSDEGMSERFVVHFAEYTGIGDQPNADINGIYAANQKVFVNFTSIKGEIVIYDILGQEVSRSIATNGLNSVPVANGNAVYIVKVITDNNTVTKKVFVK